ncbi:hypothetical protein BMETH_1005_0 [methanotrophic bacterial endosymbiont of Bathymodiolus sp.]|nr:hypothetical protein BMETH_1005_0 [methanotrophic bacterial endosymbiont of Bathymodiolus sp.]
MINHMDDARKNGIHADGCRLNGYYSGTIDTATDDFMPYFFNDRNAFAGNHGFVNCRDAIDYLTVRRNFFTRAYKQVIIQFYIIDTDSDFPAIF